MKPHKYREELQNRTISPSPDSWERLNEKLSSHENNRQGSQLAVFESSLCNIGFYFGWFLFLKTAMKK